MEPYRNTLDGNEIDEKQDSTDPVDILVDDMVDCVALGAENGLLILDGWYRADVRGVHGGRVQVDVRFRRFGPTRHDLPALRLIEVMYPCV